MLIASLSSGTVLVDQNSVAALPANTGVFVYQTGTSTPVTVYADSSSGTTLSQPLFTDSNGQLPGYLDTASVGLVVDFVPQAGGSRIPTHVLAVGDLPVSAATITSVQAAASTPTIWLDTYYDSAAFASKSAAIQAAHDAAVAARAVLECQAGRVYTLDTAALQVKTSSAIIIEGHGATFKANWGKPRCIDLTRPSVSGDYSTFNKVDVRDLKFDANNLTAASNQSVVGNMIDGGGVNAQRINAQDIYFRRCEWINVPVGTSVSYGCFSLGSYHLAGGETQTNLLRIHVEGAVMRGGNYACFVGGQCATTTGVEVFLDQIFLDFDWDSGTTPVSGTPGGNQIGSLGFGNYCEVRLKAANAGDTGLEVDGMQTAHVWGEVTDSYNANVFTRNFHAPIDVNSQRMTCHGMKTRCVNLQPSSAGGGAVCAGFQLGHTSTPNPTVGEMVLENCSYHSTATQLRANGTAINVPANALASRLTIVGTFNAIYSNVNDSPAGTEPASPVYILPASSQFTLGGGGNIRVVYAGTGSANTKPRTVVLSPQTGCVMRVDLGDIIMASSLAGVSAGNTRGVVIGLSGLAGGSIRGRIRRIGWEAFSGGDTTPSLFMPGPSTMLTIDGRLAVDEIDLRKDPAASPLIVNTANTLDTANKALIPVRSANMPTYPIASVSPTATTFNTGTFTSATGNQYIGSLPAEIQFATGTGAGVTSIDVSKDGTTYENFWTQASGAMSQSVIVPVENGDFVKVTFATTVPSIRVRYRRAT